jgi:uncharacterized membrane protein
LLGAAAEQISRLIHDELHYAQKEVQAKFKRSAAGVAMFAAAALITFLALAALVTASIIALAHVVTAWLASILVAVGLLVLAVLIGLVGKRVFTAAAPPLPTEALASTQADIQITKEAVKA